MMGCMRPLKNWLFHAELYRRAFVSLKLSTVPSSRLNAFTMAWPENVSSTRPLISPSVRCCARKNFCERFTTTMMSTTDTGRMTTVTSVMSGLMVSIMTSTPTMVVTDVMSCVTPWFRLCPSVSTSLVMRESVSPTELRSK